jgi:predicted house-cleaning noncanonical NTP pyrophosphatase (MazG superfamily)
VPAIIAADGHQPITRVLDDAGYEAALRAKLLEEAHEAPGFDKEAMVSCRFLACGAGHCVL